MPYRESIFFAGGYFHVFCRGNEKRDIFLEAKDYQRLLRKMEEYKIIHRVSIICYCLMPNHFHLLLRQNTINPLSSFMHRLTVSYSMYFNRRYDRVGHLFQGSFKAKLITKDEYLLHLSRYIHLNPRKITGSIPKLENYPWSSYSEYLSRNNREICEKAIILNQFNINPTQTYRRFVNNINVDAEEPKIKNLIKNLIIEVE